jgi:hypothetical protein
MDDELVTVATYWSPIEARVAKNRLEAAGVRAFMADELTVEMNWALGNAVHGIKLQVRRDDLELADEALGNEDKVPPDELDAVAIAAATEEEAAEESVETDATDKAESATPDEAEPESNDRQRLAQRVLRGAILGVLFLPLQVWVFCLLIRLFVSDEPLGQEGRKAALIAAAINLPLMVVLLAIVRMAF